MTAYDRLGGIHSTFFNFLLLLFAYFLSQNIAA